MSETGKGKRKGGWSTLIVRVPTSLVEEMEELIRKDLHQTKSEFVREAIRAYLYEYAKRLYEKKRMYEKLERSEEHER